MKANRNQYTIRDVPFSVDRVLRKRAAERGVSFNRVLVEALEKAAGVGAEPKTYDDLDGLIGSWVADPEVDGALAEERRVEPRDWQ